MSTAIISSDGTNVWVKQEITNFSISIRKFDDIAVSHDPKTDGIRRFSIEIGHRGYVFMSIESAIALRDQLTTCIDQAILDDVEAEQG